MIAPVAHNRLETLTQQIIGQGVRQASSGPKPMVITLVGSGNSAHVCAALFEANARAARANVVTQVLSSTPEAWLKHPEVMFPTSLTGGKAVTQRGTISKVSSNPAELLPESDIVMWTGPVYATNHIFEKVKPYIDVTRTVVGTIFAQGLVHVSAVRTFGPDVRFFALRNIPWLCRMVEKGRLSEIVGPKSSIEAVGMNLPPTYLQEHLEPLFYSQKIGLCEPKIRMITDFCPIIFNPANQIIHPAVYWSHFRHFNGVDALERKPDPLNGDRPHPGVWLYRDMDETAGICLQTLDEELQNIKDAYFQVTGAEGCKAVLTLRDRLLAQYGSQIADTSTMAKLVSTNAAYALAKTPVLEDDMGRVKPFPTHRVVQDDIGWGLCVLVSIAERLEVDPRFEGRRIPREMMLHCIRWHQFIMGKEFLGKDDRLNGKDCGELVLIGLQDGLDMVSGAGYLKRHGSARNASGASGARAVGLVVPSIASAGEPEKAL